MRALQFCPNNDGRRPWRALGPFNVNAGGARARETQVFSRSSAKSELSELGLAWLRGRAVEILSAPSPLALFGLRFFFDRQQCFWNGLESSRGDWGAA